MTSYQCPSCKHYLGLSECEAFPDGIPEQIITGEHDHAEPYSGDNGIRFEPVTGTAGEVGEPPVIGVGG